jgi:hypothetical protein
MACEKCWGDAFMRLLYNCTKTQGEHYRDLLEERKHTPCTRAEQEGQFATQKEGTTEA